MNDLVGVELPLKEEGDLRQVSQLNFCLSNLYEFHLPFYNLQDCPFIRVKASQRVFSLLSKTPLTAEVVVNDPGFFIPRIVMHICSASIITITPNGYSISIIAFATWVVNLSWSCGRLAYPSTTLASLLKPVIFPFLGI